MLLVVLLPTTAAFIESALLQSGRNVMLVRAFTNSLPNNLPPVHSIPNCSTLRHPRASVHCRMAAVSVRSSPATPAPSEDDEIPDSKLALNYMPIAKENSSVRLGLLKHAIVKLAMSCYVTLLLLTIPMALLPLSLISPFLTKSRREKWALHLGEACCRWWLRLIPFCCVKLLTQEESQTPVPSIWTANHVSPIDTMLLLAFDKDLRGRHRRPLKVLYWKGLDRNPVLRYLFHMAGFISVDMADNGNGNPNQYDKKTFKQMLRQSKQAMADGFDLFLLPEGQLNPWPERGLLPIFRGAFALAHASQRPIRLVGIHGTHHLWHATQGMVADDNRVQIQVYPKSSGPFATADDFERAFVKIVGHFGATGKDISSEEMKKLLSGSDGS